VLTFIFKLSAAADRGIAALGRQPGRLRLHNIAAVGRK